MAEQFSGALRREEAPDDCNYKYDGNKKQKNFRNVIKKEIKTIS
jgi:hypothetical protein